MKKRAINSSFVQQTFIENQLYVVIVLGLEFGDE